MSRTRQEPVTLREVLLRSKSLAVVLLGVAASLSPAFAGDGDLDTSFDGDGVWVATTGSHSFTRAVVAPDGALVVFGTRLAAATRSFHWRRVLPTGPGTLCTFSPPGATGVGNGGITFDSAGRLVFSGRVTFGDADPVVGVMRFMYPACDLDEDLDGGGFTTHAPGVSGATLLSVADVETARWLDGVIFRNRILVPMTLNASSFDAYLMRLHEDGSLDTGFGGGDGVVALGPDRVVNSSARTIDGRYLIAGYTSTFSDETFILKVDRDGAPVAAFGDGGETVLDLEAPGDQRLGHLALAPDGRIALAGRTNGAGEEVEQAVAAVLTADGELDLSWGGGDGWMSLVHAGSEQTDFRFATFQGDGKLLLAGRASDPLDASDDEAFAVRLLRAGGVDAAFGQSGVTPIDLDNAPQGEDLGNAVALTPDGRIWIAGSSEVETSPGETDYRPFAALLENSYIFADGFERGSTASW